MAEQVFNKLKVKENKKYKEIIHPDEIDDVLQRALHSACRHPDRFNASLRLEIVGYSLEFPYAVDFRYKVQPLHLNPLDGVHGGVIASLEDACGGIAVRVFTKHMIATTDLHVSYLRAMRGESYIIHAELGHVGKRIVNSTIDVIDEDTGELASTAMATYIILDATI